VKDRFFRWLEALPLTRRSTLKAARAALREELAKHQALAAANAAYHEKLLQLIAQNQTLGQANTAPNTALQELKAIDAVVGEQSAQRVAQNQPPPQANATSQKLEAINTALRERLAQLEEQNRALTEAAIARELKLQEKGELDYQILMTHQQILAGIKDAEPGFFALYERCKPFTMTSVERLYSLYKCIQYVVAAGIPGDIAECGVWRGGSCMLAAHALLEFGGADRRILMFDTFEGHPRPDPERDVDLWNNHAFDDWRLHTKDGTVKGWGLASLEEVRSNLGSTGYPSDKLIFIKGMLEATVHENVPERLAVLRLDTDWYESTRAALTHLYPALAPGGVLIVDDYGHYKGQRQAVDEYFRACGARLLFHRIDYSCRVAVKRDE
jgi:hypothetical protein